MSTLELLAVADGAAVSRSIIETLAQTAPPDVSFRAAFFTAGEDSEEVNYKAEFVLALHTAESLRNEAFLRVAQRQCSVHWLSSYFIPPPSAAPSLAPYIGQAEIVLCSEERFYRAAIAETPDRGAAFVVLPVPIQVPPVMRSEPQARLRIATTATAALEYRLLPLLRCVSEGRLEATLTCLCEPADCDALFALAAEFPAVEVQTVPGRTPARWRALLEASDLAYMLSESGYDDLLYYLRLALAAGKPVLCSNFGSAEALPKEAHWSIRPGINEQAEIAAALEEIRTSPELLATRVDNAVSYATLLHEPSYVWHQLKTVLQRSLSGSRR